MTPEDRIIVEARKAFARDYAHRQPERSGRVFRACRKHPQIMRWLTAASPGAWNALVVPKESSSAVQAAMASIPWKRIIGRTWR